MTAEYSTDCSRTANFPPLFVFRTTQVQPPREELVGEIGGGIRLLVNDNTTAPLPLVQSQSKAQDISATILNVNKYIPNIALLAIQRGRLASRFPRRFSRPRNEIPSEGIGSLFLASLPSENEPVDTPSVTSGEPAATLSLVRDHWAAYLAIEQIKRARTEAVAGNMRIAYRYVYRGLDELFRRGKWKMASSELAEICMDPYPAAFGIGAMRFSSEAAEKIPGWQSLLMKLADLADQQGMDARRAMRGLLHSDGNQ